MSDRETLIVQFIKQHKWDDAQRHALASDASFRRYERLVRPKGSAMLMDAPPVKEDVSPFIYMDNYLRRRGLSAPKIYAQDEKNGLLLLEDFGNDSYTNLLAGKSALSGQYSERELYIAAVEVLIQLSRSTLPAKMPDYDHDLLMRECRLLTEWFLPNISQKVPDIAKAAEEYAQIWQDLIRFAKVSEDVVVLRDYHADNLMWLPQKNGVQQVGLLDFQDAVIGSPIYDLVSLLEDARRDVAPDTVHAAIEHYLTTRKSIHRDNFMAAYATLAAQRNCKIIGIFARLAIRDHKPKYIGYMPRVWKHLEHDLKHPVMAPLAAWMEQYIPTSMRRPEAFILPKKERELA